MRKTGDACVGKWGPTVFCRQKHAALADVVRNDWDVLLKESLLSARAARLPWHSGSRAVLVTALLYSVLS